MNWSNMDQLDYEVLGIATVFGGGYKINLPRKVREIFGLKDGDELVFYRKSDGTIGLTKNVKWTFELK